MVLIALLAAIVHLLGMGHCWICWLSASLLWSFRTQGREVLHFQTLLTVLSRYLVGFGLGLVRGPGVMLMSWVRVHKRLAVAPAGVCTTSVEFLSSRRHNRRRYNCLWMRRLGWRKIRVGSRDSWRRIHDRLLGLRWCGWKDRA